MQDKETAYDLTIITACWNVRDNVVKTVASVLEQKVKGSIRIEHLLVDGASTDGTPELLERLKQEGKIESYISEPDKGIYDAMNKGIDHARGKVLFFLNADDILNNETDLADLVLPIVKDECDACCGQWTMSDEPDVTCRSRFHQSFHLTPCCHQAFFMSKEWYLKLGKYDDSTYRSAADADIIWSMYTAGGRIKDIPKLVIYFQLGGFSQNTIVRFMDELVLLTYKRLALVQELMRQKPDYARFMIIMMAKYLLFFRTYCQAPGTKRHTETQARLRELCQAYRAAWKGHPIDRLLLRVMAWSALRSTSTGRWESLRRLCFWSIPALFLSMPKEEKYSFNCPPYTLGARISKLFAGRAKH